MGWQALRDLEQALEDRLRLLDGFSIPTRYPDSYPEGTPGEHFGRLQSDQALLHAGVITSWDGRDAAGVGSDLDLLLILKECSDPIWERLRRWDTGSLPLACDLLVYSLAEWRSLPGWNPLLAAALQQDTRWLAGRPPLGEAATPQPCF